MTIAPDLALARRFLTANPPPGRVLLCAITGSHHYGFPSPDSDLDIKGIHIAPTPSLLGLSRPADNHERLTVFDGVECDLTTHELGRALSLMLKGNGNILEHIFSPHQLFDGPATDALRALARGAISQAAHGHYAGYLKGMQREHLRRSPPRVKSMLYTLRVALTGVHLLRTGEVLADLPELAIRYDLPGALALIQHRLHGSDEEVLPDPERHQALWPRLESMLERARRESPLPEAAQNREEVEAWLVRTRIEALGAEEGDDATS